MPRNIAHRAQSELEWTVRRLRPFCATEHAYTTPESLWAAVEKNNSGAVFLFDFARLLRLNLKTRHSLLILEGRPESQVSGKSLQGGVLSHMQNLALAVHTPTPGRGCPKFGFYRAAEQAPVAQDRTAAAARGNYEATIRGKDA